jgi:hypothetical protein
MINLQEAFEKYSSESHTFPQIQNPLHPKRPDIAAFLLLDKLVPNDGYNIIGGAGHDVIWLDTNIELLAEVATEEDILYLVRCGVRLGDDTLEMFT